MGKKDIIAILSGAKDSTIRFEVLRKVLLSYNFTERIKGSHHIFTRSDIAEIINIQPKKNLAKPYQVKQIRNIILKYKLFSDE